MSSTPTPGQRRDLLFEELAELAGRRNAIDARIVEIVAEMERDELCGSTGARSASALVAWKLGSSSTNAQTRDRGQTRATPGAATEAPAAALDRQELRRTIHELADHPSP
jgi:hypothetical protein